jgi:hypothetical protein
VGDTPDGAEARGPEFKQFQTVSNRMAMPDSFETELTKVPPGYNSAYVALYGYHMLLA